jgi:pimeloyl-ACP methyl ester carboxylesterase
MTTTTKRDYCNVNGLQMYYEIHGSGRPLVLLHGGLSTIDVDFGGVLPTLAETRRVIAIEQQAHGHTADMDRPLTYEQMAEDTVALLRQLGVETTDIFGYSVGAGIALVVAMRYPELVGRMVLAAPAYNRDGTYPEVWAGIDDMKPKDMAGSPFQEAYARVALNPQNWAALIEKMQQLDREFQGWPAAEVQSIRAPVMVIIGDADIIKPEHAVELFRLLGGGVPGDLSGLPPCRLAVLPGTTHITLGHRAVWLVSMVTEFLDAPMP